MPQPTQKTGKRPRSNFDKTLSNISKPLSTPYITQADARNLRELALIAKEWCSQTSKKWSNPKELKRTYRIPDDRRKQQIGRQYHEWHKDTLRNHDIQLEFWNACLKLSQYWDCELGKNELAHLKRTARRIVEELSLRNAMG
jgi:hypothetical protein